MQNKVGKANKPSAESMRPRQEIKNVYILHIFFELWVCNQVILPGTIHTEVLCNK